MIRLLISLFLVSSCFAGYDEGKDFAKSGMSGKKSMFQSGALAAVPNYDGKHQDSGDVNETTTMKAMQNSEVGKFLIESSSRDTKFEFGSKDPLLLGADRVLDDPLGKIAASLSGKVNKTIVKPITKKICEESGEASLISCKYLLKPVPYYGEKDCEEQHEKSIEVCKKELDVKAIYDNKTCEQIGNPVIKTVTATLEEKANARKGIAIPLNPKMDLCFDGVVRYARPELNPYNIHHGHVRYASQELYNKVVEAKRRGDHLRLGLFGNLDIYSAVDTFDPDKPLFSMTRKVDLWFEPMAFHWVGGEYNISGASCVKVSEVCTDSKDRIMHGVKFVQPCWSKAISYHCKFPSKNNCGALRESGCSQSSSTCLKRVEGVCVNYQYSMQCFKGFSDNWRGCESFVGRKSCSVVKKECVDKVNRFISGRDVKRDCWEMSLSHACSYPALNNCEQLRLPSCKQIKEVCKKKVNGTCVVMSRTYKCVDGINESWESNCHDLEKKNLQGICDRITNETSEKKVNSIEGFDVDAVWERTAVFKCRHPARNDCASLLAMGCKIKAKRCKKMESNSCVVWEKDLICGGEPEEESSVIDSGLLGLDGSLSGEPDVNDSNLAKVAAQLAVLEEIDKEYDGSSADMPSMFVGESRKCTWGDTGFNNCCRLDGWGKVVNLGSCKVEEKQLAHLRNEKYCMPSGTYCSVWAPLKAYCITRKNGFCCFRGKLAKVIQREARLQLGIKWGDGKHPNCEGLSMDVMGRVDWNTADLTELYDDVTSTLKLPDPTKTKNNMAAMIKNQISKSSSKKEVRNDGDI